MTTHETKVVHTTDRFMKVIFTVIALCLVWLSVVCEGHPAGA